MAEKLVSGDLFLRKTRESVSSLDLDKLAPISPEAGGEESSDSEGEQEDSSHKLIRKVSTSGQMRSKKSVKEGLLLKQTSSFQRWKRRYFKLRGRTLYYAKDSKSLIFDEVDLSDASVAETSTKNINNSFTVITPFRKLILCAENRKEMEDWISALKSVQKWEIHEATQFNMEHFSGMHNWYACSHARPTFCNVCREALSGVTSHGLSCEVCKFKAHKRCAVRATNNCKWTTLASIGTEIIEDEDGVAMPHQWLEGNLPVSARCAVCDRTCGSVRRLQDWRCLWCKAIVHSACKELFGKRCPLGQYKVSIIPPTALNSIDSDGFWKATCPSSCSSPLLAFVNSKSGDNQGVKFLRKFKQFLNPAQVFDLMNGGPHLGLRLFQKFSTFRILVCGGDGSVGWVLSEIDALGLHKQCQLGVLPLGTGNDLARVLGWGSLCDDDTQLLQILEKLERATTKMLDRWSVLTYEAPKQSPPAVKEEENGDSNIQAQISHYADSVAFHLAKILESDKHSVVISSAKFLCGTVNDFVAEVGRAYKRATENKQEAELMARKCAMLNEKLDSLVRELNDEAQAIMVPEGTSQAVPAGAKDHDKESSFNPSPVPRIFKSKEQLMLRANSLKKALRQIIEQAEKAVDEQNKQTQAYCGTMGPTKKDSSEECNKEAERLSSRRETVTSATSSIILDRPDSFGTLQFPEDPSALQFSEKCVMNNYFGIGLDAKISLEFNNKRDEHPKKCSSRTKNMMWYGVLGTKELLQRTYKNLEQRVQLECDGVPISLPSLQGIAVLNIPSYAGGINFWGGTKEDNNFGAPSFDDKKLEVVAVFGSIQMAVSRVINLQHHRIAQCRLVKITIRGDEGVPVQVDGEAWIQPPGIIKIQHKNRAQMLTRDRAFESTLKSWEDKQKGESYRAATRPRLSSQQSMEYLTDEETGLLLQVSQVAETLIARIHEAAKAHKAMEQELAHAVNTSSLALSETLSNKAAGSPEFLSRNAAVEVVLSIKALYTETRAFLEGKVVSAGSDSTPSPAVEGSLLEQGTGPLASAPAHGRGAGDDPCPLQLDSPQEEEALHGPLSALGQELQRLLDIHWLAPIAHSAEEENVGTANKGSFKLRLNIPKPRKDKDKMPKQKSNTVLPADKWGSEEVAAWLEALGLGEYRDIFVRHDIQGSELILLERRDLKDLGITKVGHMKRILQAIKELSSVP
ncbi:diacylglycerol kinase kappa isoform X1 [Apteryx rowi]|uniref:diacylglycerol kinase kappa isoform X1 n=1 Tax=Apteryx rowi TaxID=308060 RepID=UPI000E1E0B82|nr:diacylglycerol kinase kappa isoform X1 [Apteryx rowi]XP_025947236.1 diacylglycerol kinase kappa isoform X1 [Apteryx rowi]